MDLLKKYLMTVTFLALCYNSKRNNVSVILVRIIYNWKMDNKQVNP